MAFMRYSRKKHVRLFALLLAIGLLAQAVSASALFAAEFTDGGSIGPAYKEAVDRMAARGVLNGFPDGSFQPRGTLTREQGAKIVVCIILGGEAEVLRSENAPFADVAADRWSAPYIAWCAGRLILLGYGDGRCGPNDAMTGDQFAKMLLCALELARDGNYVGLADAWFAAVRQDAEAAGLYTGDVSMAIEGGQPITRQQAALMAWNAIQAAEAKNAPAAGTADPGSTPGYENPPVSEPENPPVPEPQYPPVPEPQDPSEPAPPAAPEPTLPAAPSDGPTEPTGPEGQGNPDGSPDAGEPDQGNDSSDDNETSRMRGF